MLQFKQHAFAAKCPRHPGYQPTSAGLAGIKAGCPYCMMLWRIYTAHGALLQAIGDYQHFAGDRAAARGAALDFRPAARSATR